MRVKERSVSGLTKAFAAIVDKDLNSGGRYEIAVPHDKSSTKPSIRIEAAAPEEEMGNDVTLALVTQTSLDLPPLHHHIDDSVVSILFEQVTTESHV